MKQFKSLSGKDIIRKTDEYAFDDNSNDAWTEVCYFEVGKKVSDVSSAYKYRRPLKSKESRKPIVNTGFTAAALWSELKRRQGGPYPCKKEFLIVTEGRFNAAVAAALRKA